jgi:hypothetical protein
MAKRKRRARYKRGLLAGIIAGAVMAVGYMVVDWVAPAAATTMVAVEQAPGDAAAGEATAEDGDGDTQVAERSTVAFRKLGFIYYLARFGVGFIIGLVWGLFYAAVEQHVWGVGFLKGIVFGAAVWLLGGLPEALNKYLTYEFGGLAGLWAFGGLLVSILGGVTVSLVYGRVDYDDRKREPVRVRASISGGETGPDDEEADEDREALPPGDDGARL